MKKREIKFRGWFQRTNGYNYWVFGYVLRQENNNFEITDGVTYWVVDEDSIHEFTGLYDMNGKEIYEGDIIKWDNGQIERVMHTLDWDNVPLNMKDKFNNPFISAWGCTDMKYFKCFMNIYDPTRYAEVIGNIYEHPHLLNQ